MRRADVVDAPQLLADLQRPDMHELVGWRQDEVHAPPRPLPDGRWQIATENQGCWRAARRPDGVVELGETHPSGWRAWRQVDLAELLCRMLVEEAVLGHGPSLGGSKVPADALRRYELLPPLHLPEGPAELPAVLAGRSWFGVTVGDAERWVWAAPVEAARATLAPLGPDAFWFDSP